MAKYTKRKDGRYSTTFTPAKGAKPIYVYANSSKELDDKIAELKTLANKGVCINDGNRTFRDVAEMWYNLTKANKSFSTQRNARNILNLHIYPHIGHIILKNLKSYHIQKMINEELEKGLTDTVRRVLEYSKSILNFAINNDFILKNVANSVEFKRFKSKPRKPLTKFEREVIEKVAETHKHGPMILTILYSGMRREEILPLEKIDIILPSKNNTKKVISINKAIYFKNNQAHIKTTKNEDTREIPILDRIEDILKQRIKESPSKYLFPMSNGEICSETSYRRAIESFINACNKYIDDLNKDIKEETNQHKHIHFTAHVLRHTFCTFLYYAGIGLKEAQEIMGHHTAEMTLEVYTHLDKEQSKGIAETINNYINNL